MPSKRKKPNCKVQWLVIEFIERTDEIHETNAPPLPGVVPNCWLMEKEGQQFCYWPRDSKKVHTMLNNLEMYPVNDKDFELIMVRIVSRGYGQ